MTKFEDELFGQLMAEHGHELRTLRRPAAPAPAPARRRARIRRPVWLATGAAGAVAAATAGVMALGSAPAMAAYSVTKHDGTVSVSVARASGVAGANKALHKLQAGVVVVPVGAGCPSIDSLPRPDPAPHLAIQTSARAGAAGQPPTVSVRIKGTLPAGDTLILAFSGDRQTGSVGAGGIITGPVPGCVSLPSLPQAG